jgi:hypothetical protein
VPRYIVRVFASILLTSFCAPAFAKGPRIKISLPPEIPSESVDIEYYLEGAFGGRGNFVPARPKVDSYEVDASYNGEAAGNVKLVVYAPGCQFETFDVPIEEGASSIQRNFECSPLPMVSLAGNILQHDLTRGKTLEVVITYEAFWECSFFGLADCAVPQVQLARVPVNADGSFEATITDFSSDRNTSASDTSAELHLVLRDSKTWNPIGIGLSPPEDLRTKTLRGLAIKPFYRNPLEFEVVLQKVN